MITLRAPGDIDMAALLRPIHTRRVPYSEWAGRRREGAAVDAQRIDNVLRNADMGIMWPLADLAREMLALNAKASGIVGKGLLPLATADHEMIAAEDGLSQPEREEAKKIAAKVRAMVAGIKGFRQALLDLAWGFFDGRAALENQFERRGSEIWPTRLDWVIPQRLSFDDARRLIVVDRFGDYGMFVRRGPALADVPGKFIEFTPRMFGDLQEREGLAPRVLFWLLFDRVGWRHRMILTQRFGLGWRIVEQEVAKTLAGLKIATQRNDGGEGGAATDDSAVLDYTEAEVSSIDDDGTWIGLPGQKLTLEFPPSEIADFFNQGSDQIMDRIAWLVTHNGVSDAPRGDSIVRKAPEDILFEYRGQLVAEAVQHWLINVLVELNYGAAALRLAPTWQLNTKPQRDRDKEVERILKVAAAVPVGAEVLYEASMTRAPNGGEKVVSTVQLTPSDVGAVIRVNEARAKIGEPPDTGPDGEKWVTEHSAAFSTFGAALGEQAAKAEAPATAALPQGEGSSDDAIGALRGLLEDADEDGQADAADDEAHLARWFVAEGRKVQPRSANGTPEVLVERGVREGARHTSRWAETMADAADGTAYERVYRNLQRAAAGLDLEPLARSWERRILHGLMLGGLDASWEMTHEAMLEPAEFALPLSHLIEAGRRFVAPSLVVPGVPPATGIADFTTMPFGEAIKSFTSRKVLTRRTFDRLAAEAKKRAFTVAGLARKDMLTTAHDELAKAIEAGSDLRTFSKSLADRFDAAGWTQINPSHVETVFRNGVMGAYGDGRRAQMTQPAVLAARPYWQILGVDDSRTREPHRKAHGKVLPAGDPFFDRAGPPFGHNCRCRYVSRSANDLKRLGLTPTIGAQLRGLPDDGWDTSGSLL